MPLSSFDPIVAEWFETRFGSPTKAQIGGWQEGRFYNFENWGLVAALGPSIRSGLLQLFCVDSLDSETFYCRSCDHQSRIRRHNDYEQYVLCEVLPLIRSVNRNTFLIAHGCSIGAYHAVNIALRHPGLFGKVVALSRRYDLTRAVGFFADVFEGHYSEDIYFHMPNHFIPNLNDMAAISELRRLDIVLAVGERDYCHGSNQELSGALSEKCIPNKLAVLGWQRS